MMPYADAITYTLRVITYYYADMRCDKSHLIGLLSFHHFVVPLPPQREARKILSLHLLRGGFYFSLYNFPVLYYNIM